MGLLRRIDSGDEGEKDQSHKPQPLGQDSHDSLASSSAYLDLKTRVRSKLLAAMKTSFVPRSPDVRAEVEALFVSILSQEGIVLSQQERQRLFEALLADAGGDGPLEPLLADDSITEIMINGPKDIFIERGGRISRASVTFENKEHLYRIIDRMLIPAMTDYGDRRPLVETHLSDGSRVTGIIPRDPSLAPVLTIHRPSKPLTIEDLIRFGTVTADLAKFFRACVVARLNIAVIGRPGSGKTMLLNVLANFIPAAERIIVIEDLDHIQLSQEHVLAFQWPLDANYPHKLTRRDLLRHCFRMRPGRIIILEAQADEAFELISAMNRGFTGALFAVTGTSPDNGLFHLELLAQVSKVGLSERIIKQLIASSIDLVCQIDQLPDSSRKVVRVAEIQGVEDDAIILSDLYVFEQTGLEAGKVIGQIKPTGLRPKFMGRIERAGIHLPPSVFGI
jgi:pilus assembly protein CpaF